MNTTRWDLHFLTSTRGRIVCLLRFSRRTVSELAEMLDLTSSAVRSQLSALEEDGLVQRAGTRRGVRKPHQEYDLTPEAMSLFPKAHEPVLREVIRIFCQRFSPQAVDEMVREVGRRLANKYQKDVNACSGEERLEKALEIFRQIGGLAGTEERERQTFVLGYSCPLPSLTPEYPEACRLMESFLTDLIGHPLEEKCDRKDPPQCLFMIRSSPIRSSPSSDGTSPE